MAVEMHVTQTSPAYEANKDDPVTMALLRPMQFFDGQMTIRIHEADGTPYEHVLDIRQQQKKFEVPFNTKYKRVRRHTKRFIARQQAAEAAANPEAAELIGVVDMSFGLGIWEDDASREEWKVADWSEADEAMMATATYEWIRLDTDIEWLTKISFHQEAFMWVSQLSRDRDVIAQIEAIHALARIPSKIVSSTFTKTVLTTTYFFRVRSEAALSLVPCAGGAVEFLGLYHLFKLFFRYCYDPQNKEDIFKSEVVPKPNDFSDFSEYFVRKSLVTALSQVRLDNGDTLPIVRKFLLDQLKYNDNSTNNFSDSHYVAHIIGALGCALVSTTPPEKAELQGDHLPQVEDPRVEINKNTLNVALAEVERYRDMDRVIPSWRNVITVSILEFNAMLMMANCIPNNPAFFLLYTREGNSIPVRVAAFDGLFLMKWFQPEVLKYLLAIISRDSSRIVSRHVASAMCESLAIQFAIGEIKMPPKEPESILIEEDATKPEISKEPKKSEVDLMIKTLRKDKEIGRNAILRRNLMPMMLNATLDYEVRWSMLKLADLTFRAVEEPLPKLTIHLPPTLPTPVVEAPPSKRFKLSLSIGGAQSGAPSPHPASAIPSNVDGKPPAEVATPSTKLKLKPLVREPVAPPPPPPIKVKPVPSWAKNGLPLQEKKILDALLKRVTAHAAARWFLHPVDPVRDGAPTYFEIVKRPMDLSTIAAKLKAGEYGSRRDFADDFNLMLSNAYIFNPAGTDPHKDALEIEKLFKKAWKQTDDAVEKDKAKVKPVAPPPPPPPVVAATPASQEMDLDDELLEAANVPGEVSGDEDAPFDEDVDDLLLGTSSAAPSAPPPKIKLKPIRRPAPDMDDDIDADLYDAADAIGGIEPPAPIKPKQEEVPIIPRLKVTTGASKPPTARVTPEVGPSRSVEPTPAPLPPPRPSTPHTGAGTPSSSRKRAPSQGLDDARFIPVDVAKCKALLQKLTEVHFGWIFAYPVDSTQPGLESYYEEISHPMDYQTMGRKLDRKKYASMEDFADDLKLIYTNGRKFNAASPDILSLIDNLEILWKREWPSMLKRKMPADIKKQLVSALNQIKVEDVNMIFHYPVDPIALGIPHYFDVIPKENSRDLATIKGKLEKGLYQSADQVNQDIELMFGNAYKFNGKDSPISNIAMALEASWGKLYNKIRAAADAPANKKPRMG